MKLFAIVLGLTCTAGLTLGIGSPPIKAQSSIQNSIENLIKNPNQMLSPTNSSSSNNSRIIYNSNGQITRAMNLARQAAEKANGGLSNYRAEAAMYGPSENAPYVDNGNGTVTFTFLGGRPVQPPTLQSVVTVSLDGSQVTMDYNGPIRSAQ